MDPQRIYVTVGEWNRGYAARGNRITGVPVIRDTDQEGERSSRIAGKERLAFLDSDLTLERRKFLGGDPGCVFPDSGDTLVLPPRFLQVESLEAAAREIRSRASLSGLETDRSAASIRAIRSDSGPGEGLRATRPGLGSSRGSGRSVLVSNLP